MVTIMELLQNQVTVITGGTAGIGKAIARTFAAHGAIVCLLASNAERGALAVQEIQQVVPNGQLEFYPVDVSQFQAVRTVLDSIVAKHGRVDVLVNNAGITRDGLLMKM